MKQRKATDYARSYTTFQSSATTVSTRYWPVVRRYWRNTNLQLAMLTTEKLALNVADLLTPSRTARNVAENVRHSIGNVNAANTT
ncbi:hypothetical protein ACTL32_18355 [Planococcus sp. FY231025]|uniref:hypothetical protein n=1 Tax=Planococcus sp. FY231025 TaxID=3455699 RepID=UPI003F9212C2